MNRSREESHPAAVARPSLDSAAQNRPRATGKWYAALLAEDKGRKGDWLLGKINGRRNREVEAGGSNPHGCYGTRIYTVWCRECDGFLRAAWAVDFKPFPADLNLHCASRPRPISRTPPFCFMWAKTFLTSGGLAAGT